MEPLNNSENIAGFSFNKIRRLLRTFKSVDFSVNDTIIFFDINLKEATKLLNKLERFGYIEQAGDKYQISKRGELLLTSSIKKSMTRTMADRKIKNFIKRISLINDDKQLLYNVDEAWIFGDYVMNAPTIFKLEIGIKLSKKEKNNKEHMKKLSQRVYSSQKFFSTTVEYFGFGEEEIKQKLKNGIHGLIVLDYFFAESIATTELVKLYPE